MSDKEFLREIREEIKCSTSKMLRNALSPESKPLEDNLQPEAGAPLATDPTEVDPGFEFVNLVPSDAKKVSAAKNKQIKKQQKAEAANARKSQKLVNKDEQNSEMLKKELLSKIEKVKEKLATMKKKCSVLDGIEDDGTVDEETAGVMADNDDNKMSPKSKMDAEDSELQKQYDEKAVAMKDRIKEIQNKIETLHMTAENSGKEVAKPQPIKDKKERRLNISNSSKKSDSISSLSSALEQSGETSNNNQSVPTGSGVSRKPPLPQHIVKPDNLLLLTLLTLDPTQRDDYVIKLAKERSLLVPVKKSPHKKSGALQVSPRLNELAIELKRAALIQCYGPQMSTANVSDISRPFLTVQSLEKVQDVKKVWEVRTFEEEVTYLLNNGKTTEKKDYKKELILENVSKAEKNSFLTEQNIAALAELVERLVKDGIGYIVEGVVRINQNNNNQAFVDDNTRDANVFINSMVLRKCAMDGDYVKVFVKHGDPERADQSTPSGAEENELADEGGERLQNNRGFVIEILEKRHSRMCVGTFLPMKEMVSQSQYMKFAPRDFRIPTMRVYRQNWPEAIFKNDFSEIKSVIYQAEIIDWHNDIPIGNILKSIGKCGELEVETQAILVEYDLDVSPYSDEIVNGLPGSEFQIPAEELAKRVDLRDDCVFTIDPLTAKDLDDALSCKLLKNGNYEIGVHISDVSYFLREASQLDELVKLKATSIYMVDGVYHMLPKSLCLLCSLLPGEDKLAFSVFWEITPNAKIVKTKFTKSVINSCTQLAYEHAQIMLDKPNEDLRPEDFPQIRHGYSPNYISKIVNQLQSIAVQFRARRIANGNLKINQPKLSFSLDPNTGKPTNYAVYELRTANQMIEDFMLLANSSVAEFTYSKFNSTSVLRSHFAPQDYQLKHLATQLAKHGHSLRIDSSKAIAESFESIVEAAPDPLAARAVLNIMVAKPMTRARYFCSAFASAPEEFHHYALAIPMYTHFTSPIRRYADCLVHRVLAAALEVDEPSTRTPDELSKLTGICNVKKYNAKLAGEASSLLYFKHYVIQHKSLDVEAAVLDIAPQHIELVLIETGQAIKTTYKQLSKSIEFKTMETKPIRHCLLISKEKKFPPTSLMLFSKVRVTVVVMKDALAIRNIYPSSVPAASEPNASDASGAMKGDTMASTSASISVFSDDLDLDYNKPTLTSE